MRNTKVAVFSSDSAQDLEHMINRRITQESDYGFNYESTQLVVDSVLDPSRVAFPQRTVLSALVVFRPR